MQKGGKLWAIIVVVSLLLSSVSGAFAQAPGETAAPTTQHIYLPLALSTGSATTQTGDQTMLTDQIIVRFAGAVQTATADRISQVDALSQIAGVTLTYAREMSGNSTVLKLPGRMSAESMSAITAKLAASGQVELVEPDRIMTPTPDDTSFLNQWDLVAPPVAPATGPYGANLPAAWDITTGSASVVVAVIDTGITNHSELTRRVPGYDFINDSLVANDGNGRDNDPSDPGAWITSAESASGYFAGCQAGNSSWHGSHVAGTIAANSNNGAGITGINWNAKILPVRWQVHAVNATGTTNANGGTWWRFSTR